MHKLVSGIRIFHVHDTSETARPRLTGYIEDNNGLQHDAGNLAAVLYLLQQRYSSSLRRITAAAQIAIPGFDQFVLEPQRLAPDKILLNWKQQGSDYLFGPHQLSDGSLRFIALATLLNQPREMLPPVIVIDEPELGLHPASLGLLGGLLRSVSHSSQVIAATQSVALLDEFEVAEVVVAEKRDGASEFQRLDPQALNEWLERYSLSQLREKNVIGGGPYG